MRYASIRDYDEPDEEDLFCYSQGRKHGEQGLPHAGNSDAYTSKRAYNIGYSYGQRIQERKAQAKGLFYGPSSPLNKHYEASPESQERVRNSLNKVLGAFDKGDN